MRGGAQAARQEILGHLGRAAHIGFDVTEKPLGPAGAGFILQNAFVDDCSSATARELARW